MQLYNLIMCGYFCKGFTDLLLKSKSFPDDINYFFLKNMKRTIK